MAIAKAFRLKIEADTGYKQVKKALVLFGILDKEATTLARTINNAVWVVYDNFKKIQKNIKKELLIMKFTKC